MQELHASIRSQLAVQAPSLRALALRLTSGPEAEDCVQNTMIAALSQDRPPRKLRPWLRRVLRNEIHAHHRSGGRRRQREEQTAVPEPTSDPDDTAQRAQITEALIKVLDALEDPYRSTLRRRFLLEHSTVRIAEDDGCSPATTRWRVHEGLRRVRRMLDERFEGRQQWLGGMAVLVGGPVDGAPPVSGEGADTTMTTLINPNVVSFASKFALAGAVLTGVVLGVGAVVAGSVEATPVWAQATPEPSLAAASVAIPAETIPVLTADRSSAEPSSEAQVPSATEPASLEWLGGNGHSRPFKEALAACMGAEHEGERIEVEMQVVRDTVDGPAYYQRLEVTTGREIPCTDPVDEPSPADADGVERHLDIVECLHANSDPETVTGTVMVGEPRTMMVVFGAGDQDDPALGTPLPAADEALSSTDPQHVAERLELPTLGSTRADAIDVVECMDYDCPFCRKAQASIAELLERHPEVSFHVLNNPLPSHAGAAIAARAAVAAGDQGHYFEMHAALFEDRDARTVPALLDKARALGLDVERFEADMMSEDVGRRVATQAAVCDSAGARGTPSFFVGGDLVVGAQGYQALADSLEFELAQRD